MLHLPFALVLTLFITWASLAAAQGREAGTLRHDGVLRQYQLYRPSTPPPAEGWPLVLALHGRGGDGESMARLSGFDRLAEAHGFVVVYPNGLDAQWNYLEGVPGYSLASDDTGFFRALLADLSERLPLDERRRYVVGFSNGGFMAQRLICDAPELFAAHASVGAAGFGGMERVCDTPAGTSTGVSLLLVHGTEDEVVPFAGLSRPGPFGPVPVVLSVVDTLAFWSAYGGCSAEGDSSALPQRGLSPGTEAHVFALRGCPAGHALVLYLVRGGGHTWPGQPGTPPEAAGRVNRDFDASEVAWKFFEAHPQALP